MNFFVFLAYYIICTLIILSLIYLLYKIIIKKKVKNISSIAEQEFEKFFEDL